MLDEMQLLGRDLLTTNFLTGKTGRLALVFLAGMACIHVASWWVISQRLPLGYQDFTIFYTAGRILSQGQGAQLYDNALQYRTQQGFAPYTAIRKGPLPYNHIPVEAVIFVPFSKLPYFQAYVLWNLFNVLLLAGALQILRPHLTALRGQSLSLGVLLGLAFFPVFIALVQGQDILLLLPLLALTYSALRRNATLAAGCWLGLGLFRFTLVLPLVLILAWRRAWRLLGGFALSSAFMAAASAALVGWKTTLLYPAYVLRVESRWVGPATSRDMPILRGLIETALTGIVGPRIFVSIIVVLSLALLWFCSRRFDLNSHDPRFDLSFSLALMAAVLASYHAYSHDLSVLLIPVLLVANYCRMRSGTARVWTMVAPMSVLFLTPLCAVLLFRMKLACLLAIVLLLWLGGIVREISACSYPKQSWL
jgi:hypothetical protein